MSEVKQKILDALKKREGVTVQIQQPSNINKRIVLPFDTNGLDDIRIFFSMDDGSVETECVLTFDRLYELLTNHYE